MQRILDLLIDKNSKYGNSALEPVQIFSKECTALEQLYVQIDHKLARIARGNANLEDEDVLLDLVGYLVLALIARKRTKESSDGQAGSEFESTPHTTFA